MAEELGGLERSLREGGQERNFKLTFTQLKRRVGIQWETDVESLGQRVAVLSGNRHSTSSGLSMGPHLLRSGMMLSRTR